MSSNGKADEASLPTTSEADVEQGELGPVTRWAVRAALEFRVHPSYGRRLPWEIPGIVYKRGGNIDLKLDVFTPGIETQKRPTFIYIHGGGWVHAWKEDFIFILLPYLTRGMNTVNVEYRKADQSPAPAAVEDCRDALRWVHKHAEEYGFSTSKIVVAGGSSGGHLALMTGMLDPSDGFDDTTAYALGHGPLPVAAIVNFFGQYDLTELLDGPGRSDWALEWFSGVPNRMELAKKLSPLSYVRKGLPPIISIHGTKDIPTYQQAVRFHEALDRAGVRNQLVTIKGGGHGWSTWSMQDNLRSQAMIFKFLEANGILTEGSQSD